MKPKILTVVDVPGWALDRTAKNMQSRLRDRYDFEVVYNDQAIERVARSQFDLLYVTYWKQFIDRGIEIQMSKPCVSGIRSHFKWDGGEGRPPSKETLEVLGQYTALHVPSKILQSIFIDKHPAVFYTPHGVDVELFCPRAAGPLGSPAGELVLGWAGSLQNHPGKRGLEDYLEPALAGLAGVRLEIAAREQQWRTQEEMVSFYQELDAYVCCSRTEGGPHPVLEASACGLPVISTAVGLVPELLGSGTNGILVERTVERIREAIIWLRDNRDQRIAMGEAARQIVEENWNWDLQAEEYCPFFDYALN